MEFSGTFELEETTGEEVWLALSDPVMIENALPGCQFLVRVEEDPDFDALREEHAGRDVEPTADPEVIAERAFEEGGQYAAVMQISVGPVNPTFETVVTIEEREYPRMDASGEGSAGDSSFEMAAWMELAEPDDVDGAEGDGAEADGNTVEVEWATEADVFGRIAQMGQRVLDPAANRIVKRFFSSVQDQLRERQIAEAETGDERVEPEEAESSDRSVIDRVLGRSSDS